MFNKILLVLSSLLFSACSFGRDTMSNLKDIIPLVNYSERTLRQGVKECLDLSWTASSADLAAEGALSTWPSRRYKLPMQEELWRTLGDLQQKEQMIALEDCINQAAEKAFVSASAEIKKQVGTYHPKDPLYLLEGQEDAISNDFIALAQPSLKQVFMLKFRVYFLQNSGELKLQSLLKQYNSIPYLPKKRDFEVEGYAAAHLVLQLQVRLRVYEKRIRTKESARVTDLLRKVFYEYGNEEP